MSTYAELHCISNFSFLRGASRPEELIEQAALLGYKAIAITDECSFAGVVKAHVKVEELNQNNCPIELILGSEFHLEDGSICIVLVSNKASYQELSALITLCRRRCEKGRYQFELNDALLHLQHSLVIYKPSPFAKSHSDSSNKGSYRGDYRGNSENNIDHKKQTQQEQLLTLSGLPHLWIAFERRYDGYDETRYQTAFQFATLLDKPMVACGNVHMHCRQRKPLQDTLSAIRENTTVDQLGKKLQSNSERFLRPLDSIHNLYPPALIQETLNIAKQCQFSLRELRYQYPSELTPPSLSGKDYLRQLVEEGLSLRWSRQPPKKVRALVEKELALIEELHYEYYFLTVHDIVCFARSEGILCQGRGSAANSVVCYCLFITEVDPGKTELLFERFISKERNEPPDIDVDFEHERREEVIQYIYKKYSRERAALAATVITYRSRSAIRDVGKALGFSSLLTDELSQSLGWWHRQDELKKRLTESGLTAQESTTINNDLVIEQKKVANSSKLATRFIQLVDEIMGFPRHLSQHVGGFIISDGPISRLVPVENASMPERTVIQWDKDDIESLGLLKVDVLGLGMLSAIRKTLDLVNGYLDQPIDLASIPREDPATYQALCDGDSIGVFQVESRAQISMLPRLKPRQFYDLVIQVAIVRPGPIQGDMVHPYLRRREGSEPVSYENEAIREVLSRTLGVPIFQEQVIKLAMVAAGFSGGEADQLRRAMASWGKNGNLLRFENKLVNGMQQRGYSETFSQRLFNQMKGFGSYGFPESHAASFALLVYFSAWLKQHHGTAFYAALINSQPMGFYSPSQLIQDAKRHHIEIRPIDIQHSHWDCSLERVNSPERENSPEQVNSPERENSPEQVNSPERENSLELNNSLGIKARHALRLGLRLVKGLQQASAEKIIVAREQTPFKHLQDLNDRAALSAQDREALIRANTLNSLSGNRHQSYWQNLALNWDPIALNQTGQKQHHSDATEAALNDNVVLTPPTEVQDIRSDYSYTGLTLKQHPMSILRSQPPFDQCKRCVDLQQLSHKRFVQVAGIVTGRQRPGSASGVIFLTLEDETGNMNVIIWQDLQQRCRETLLKSKLMLVKGVLERKNSVIHIIAGHLQDQSEQLEGFMLPSRDFH